MDYFNKYVSNTLAGSGNQRAVYYSEPDVFRKGRLYYKVFQSGSFPYSFLFSNIIDSTYANGIDSYANLVCDEWYIQRISVATCKSCDEADAVGFTDVTVNGAKEKTVMPGEMFYTDETEINVRENEYLCLEIVFRGAVIPNHEETLIPTFVYENESRKESPNLPFPSMVGCGRKVCAKIGFWGDSVTQGIGCEKDSYKHWCAVVANKTGREYAFWNLGLGYARATDAASGGAWFDKAKENDIVVICFGINDIAQGIGIERIKDSLFRAVNLLKRAGVRVLLQTVPPFDFEGKNRQRWDEINRYIREELSLICDAFFDNTKILGQSEQELNKARYGGHPNAEGCSVWADALTPVLRGLLGEI